MVATVFKAIAPSKLKAGAFWDELGLASIEIGKGMKYDYEKVTKTWSKKPVFTIKFKDTTKSISVIVGTTNIIFLYQDKGTKGPYPITAKPGKTLAFPSMFQRKTTPGKLTSGPGKKGGPTVFRHQVMHPGIKAGDWTPKISQIWRLKSRKIYDAAMKRGARRSGHGFRT